MRVFSCPWIAIILTWTCLVSSQIRLAQGQRGPNHDQQHVPKAVAGHDFDDLEFGGNAPATHGGLFVVHKEQQLEIRSPEDDTSSLDEAFESESKFRSQNHETHHRKKEHHRHHHHSKHPPKHRKPKKHGQHRHHDRHHSHAPQQHKHPRGNVTILTLICDQFIVDQIKCIEPSKEAITTTESFQKLNNDGTENKDKDGCHSTVTERYIDMGADCSPELPENCTPARPKIAASGIELTDDDNTEETSGLDVGIDSIDDLQDLHNTKPKNKHPYKDLCVTLGLFCGDKLYGCDFNATDLYKCKSVGSPPELEEADASVCTGEEPNTCRVMHTQLICGSRLPPTCVADPNSIYQADREGGVPLLRFVCEPGSQCLSEDFSVGATCGAAACNCKDASLACLHSFPSSCGLTVNAIYQCSPQNMPQVVRELASDEFCLTYSNGSMGASKGCICPKDGVVCGDTWPFSCNLNSFSLYDCKAGQFPTLGAPSPECRCLKNETGNDSCTSICKCAKADQVCGSTFPASCGYSESVLYNCDSPGALPTELTSCSKGGCSVNIDNDTCSEDECTCLGLGLAPTCGFSLPASCNADANTIYYCPGASGSKPEALRVCFPGSECLSKPLPVGASCGVNTCKCTGSSSLCSTAFPHRCGLIPNTLYQCNVGENPVLVETGTNNLYCSFRDFGSTFIPSSCECQGNGMVCGAKFPSHCRYFANGLYRCSRGSAPVFQKSCGEESCGSSSTADVIEGDSQDVCLNNCLCPSQRAYCGNTFPKYCGLGDSSLYSCDGPNIHPKMLEDCGNRGCMVTMSQDQCPKDPCSSSREAPICGYELPPECDADPNKIYQSVGGAGTRPVEIVTCSKGTACESRLAPVGAVCQAPGCICGTNREVCSSFFNESCGLEKNTIYSCQKGRHPIKKDACDFTRSCETLTSGATCISLECLCPTDGVVCGEVFALRCGLPQASLFDCRIGGDPVLKATCPHSCTNGQCADTCSCPDIENYCGGNWPEECPFSKSNLYKCGTIGQRPTLLEACESKVCPILPHTKDDICTPTCECEPGSFSCGSDLSDICQSLIPDFAQNAVYNCRFGTLRMYIPCAPGTHCVSEEDAMATVHTISTKPFCKVIEAPVNCLCITDSDTCGSAFSPSCGYSDDTLYSCEGGVGTEPEVAEKCLLGECVIQAGPDGCPRPMPFCQCTSNQDFCGSSFDSGCGFDESTLYSCAYIGSRPQPKEFCKVGCRINTADDACLKVETTQCTCASNAASCGSSFPTQCTLEANSLYSCEDGAGSKPKNPIACTIGSCLIILTAPDECPGPIPRCDCGDNRIVCGASFPPVCGYNSSLLYSCEGGRGTKPMEEEVCNGVCIIQSGDHACPPPIPTDGCQCTSNTMICGSALPSYCKLDSLTLYSCNGENAPPIPSEVCDDGPCVIQPGPDACAGMPPVSCKCTKLNAICGQSFPKECNYEQDTLYSCDGGNGTDPVPKGRCEFGPCVIQSGPDACTEPAVNCDCSNTNAVCGSSFPSVCGYDLLTLYNCDAGSGTTPVPEEVCSTGPCIIKPGPDICTEKPQVGCNCTKTSSICGGSFPESCGYVSHSLYLCVGGNGTYPIEYEECTFGPCVIQPGPDACTEPPPVDCKCKRATDICGGSFPKKCGYDPLQLYSCDGGDRSDPIPKETCEYGACLILPGPDACPDKPIDCNCTTDTATCGNLFSEVCGYDALRLYFCVSVGAVPRELEKCMNGPCLELPGADACTEKPLPCFCLRNTAVCGGSFAEPCGYDPHFLYTCDGGAGSTPVASTECIYGGCIIQPGSDVCAPPAEPPESAKCACYSDSDACGSTFPKACGYEVGSLYDCSMGKGETPQLKEKCRDGPCMHRSVSDVCPKPQPNCNCTVDMDTCGSTFPEACNKDNNTLYSCSAIGDVPQEKEPCTEGDCLQRAGNHLCPSKCLCKDDRTICGSDIPADCTRKLDATIVRNGRYECSNLLLPKLINDCGDDAVCTPRNTDGGAFCKRQCTCDFKNQTAYCADKFPAICKLPPNALYKCVGGQPEEAQICLENDICVPTDEDNPSNGDSCLDRCLCRGKRVVCKQNFDPACAYDGKTVYDCGEFGSQPKLREECTTGCYTYQKGGGCTGHPCACWKKGDTCGYTFPSYCNLNNHTLYQCVRKNAAPKDVGNNCDAMQRCISLGSENDVCANTNTCESNSIMSVCSQEFQPECTRQTSNINGTVDTYNLTIQVQINPGGSLKSCEVGCSDGKCQTCNCTEPGLRCGSSFPRMCNLEHNLLYLCSGKDFEPEYETNCDNEVCGRGYNKTAADGSIIRGTLNDTCLGPCVCRSNSAVCGLTFPASCKYNQTALYTCAGVAQLPKLSKNCRTGCMVTVTDHTCRDCKGKIDKATDLISSLSSTLRTAKGSNDLSGILFGEIEGQLDRIKTNLTKFRDDIDPTNYGATAAYGQLHVNATRNILRRLQNNDDYLGLSPSVQVKLDEFQKAIDDVEQCSNVNVTSCPGLVDTYKRDTNAALRLLDDTNLDAKSMRLIKEAVRTIEDVFTSKDQSKLDEAAEDLNRILILAKLDRNIGVPVAGPIDLIIGISTETLNCMSNYSLITEDLSDICSAYMLRFKGELSRISEDFPALLKETPLENTLFIPAVEETLQILSQSLRVRTSSVGNDTRTARVALNVIRKFIQDFPVLNTPNAAKILNEITNATAAADRVIACTEGSYICDGVEYIILDLALALHSEVLKDRNTRSGSAEFVKAADDLNIALIELTEAVNHVSEEPIGQACANAMKAGSAYKALPKARIEMKLTADMLRVACREEAACKRG